MLENIISFINSLYGNKHFKGLGLEILGCLIYFHIVKVSHLNV